MTPTAAIETIAWLAAEHAQMLAQLTASQDRCTRMLDVCRSAKRLVDIGPDDDLGGPLLDLERCVADLRKLEERA
jgi:hypothetical protein